MWDAGLEYTWTISHTSYKAREDVGVGRDVKGWEGGAEDATS
jgi:hypothetical protein